MRVSLPTSPALRDQDLAVRLQQAVLRRTSDDARHEAPDHNRWVAPDSALLLGAILANEARHLATSELAEQSSKNASEGPAYNA